MLRPGALTKLLISLAKIVLLASASQKLDFLQVRLERVVYKRGGVRMTELDPVGTHTHTPW